MTTFSARTALPDDPKELIGNLFRRVHTIAVIGASTNPMRASNYVMEYLQQRGYRTIPVNPMLQGTTLHGETVFGRLADVSAPVDMVDIFRNSEAAGEAIDEAIAERDRLRLWAVWTQLGVINEPAKRRAEAAGLAVVMDRCPKIEYPRLFGSRSRAEIAGD
ncbi:MAG: CoA-binding protein [Defluviicoccus sp.]|nr:MAG: CoA-binding protein [Defluviicoccus sp.]